MGVPVNGRELGNKPVAGESSEVEVLLRSPRRLRIPVDVNAVDSECCIRGGVAIDRCELPDESIAGEAREVRYSRAVRTAFCWLTGVRGKSASMLYRGPLDVGPDDRGPAVTVGANPKMIAPMETVTMRVRSMESPMV